ncbi:unnamed protein product [Haemonchus placei]|uniref:Uncharacterized protein n=1 Tax=Haemonchus placei TaxID=6290 RepID=A0A0N4W937_HAEPC|nr:unnamed protein product [Haemonchus placei]
MPFPFSTLEMPHLWRRRGGGVKERLASITGQWGVTLKLNHGESTLRPLQFDRSRISDTSSVANGTL